MSARSLTNCRSRRSGGAFFYNAVVIFYLFQLPQLSNFRGFNLWRPNAMNWRKFNLPGCIVACAFAATTATAQIRGRGISVSRIGMRGAFTPRSITRMPMHSVPMMNSTLGFRRFNAFNNGNFDRGDRFRRFHRFNEIIFIGDFGVPWWWGPWWDWNRGY